MRASLHDRDVSTRRNANVRVRFSDATGFGVQIWESDIDIIKIDLPSWSFVTGVREAWHASCSIVTTPGEWPLVHADVKVLVFKFVDVCSTIAVDFRLCWVACRDAMTVWGRGIAHLLFQDRWHLTFILVIKFLDSPHSDHTCLGMSSSKLSPFIIALRDPSHFLAQNW